MVLPSSASRKQTGVRKSLNQLYNRFGSKAALSPSKSAFHFTLRKRTSFTLKTSMLIHLVNLGVGVINTSTAQIFRDLDVF